MKKICLLLFFCFGLLFPAHAQLPAVAKTAGVARSTVVHARPLPPTPGTFVQPAFVSTTRRVTPAPTRSWLTQLQRDIKAAQLKEEHSRQVRNAKRTFPKLTSAQIIVDDFETLFVTNEQFKQVPQLPWKEEPGILYRGMGLDTDGKSIRNILENGLLLKDVGPKNDAFLECTDGTTNGFIARYTSRMLGIRYTNLTLNPHFASCHAYDNIEKNRIGILVRVSGQREYATVVRAMEDIGPNYIEEMIALVTLNDRPTWCRVELTKDGRFRLTPYEWKQDTF